MKNTGLLISAALSVSLLASPVMAEIDPGAPSASHRLQEAAGDLHSYLHHHYSAGYGTHELEDSAGAMHSALHDWQHGEMTESDIDAMAVELKAAWLNYLQSINPAGVLNNGDMELETLYETVKTSYKELRFLLRKAK